MLILRYFRQIDDINKKCDPAFQYFQSDLKELAEHTSVKRKISDWGNSISPNFLLA